MIQGARFAVACFASSLLLPVACGERVSLGVLSAATTPKFDGDSTEGGTVAPPAERDASDGDAFVDPRDGDGGADEDGAAAGPCAGKSCSDPCCPPAADCDQGDMYACNAVGGCEFATSVVCP